MILSLDGCIDPITRDSLLMPAGVTNFDNMETAWHAHYA